MFFYYHDPTTLFFFTVSLHDALPILSPIILISGVILIGLFPNWINDRLITFAASSVSKETTYETIKFWHGMSTPFIMSLVVVGLGSLLYVFKSKWHKVYRLFPGPFSFNCI